MMASTSVFLTAAQTLFVVLARSEKLGRYLKRENGGLDWTRGGIEVEVFTGIKGFCNDDGDAG